MQKEEGEDAAAVEILIQQELSALREQKIGDNDLEGQGNGDIISDSDEDDDDNDERSNEEHEAEWDGNQHSNFEDDHLDGAPDLEDMASWKDYLKTIEARTDERQQFQADLDADLEDTLLLRPSSSTQTGDGDPPQVGVRSSRSSPNASMRTSQVESSHTAEDVSAAAASRVSKANTDPRESSTSQISLTSDRPSNGSSTTQQPEVPSNRSSKEARDQATGEVTTGNPTHASISARPLPTSDPSPKLKKVQLEMGNAAIDAKGGGESAVGGKSMLGTLPPLPGKIG
ncbi:hypothetical protein BDK51DRAFT_26422, partial [Blyttiomyces helicus]